MSDPFTGWAIVELMGRRRLAGMVTADAPLLQATRLQVDLYPGDAAEPAASQFVSFPVYCLTPCTEELAREIAVTSISRDMPVARWDLPKPAALTAAPDPVEPDPGEYDLAHAHGCTDEDCDGECIG